MDNKRIVYITLSILFLCANPIASILIYNTITIPGLIFGILVQTIIILLSQLVAMWFSNAYSPSIDENCTFLAGIITLNRKRIYYSDLGYFYTRMSGDNIIVSKQGFFNSKKLFEVGFYGDIESLRFRIKENLDNIYSSEVEINRRKKSFNDWNGSIDKASDRDQKLNQILKWRS